MMRSYSPHWKEDCIKYHGSVLTGVDAHWCQEWDELPVDATCWEYEFCTCGKTRFGRVVNFIYGILRRLK